MVEGPGCKVKGEIMKKRILGKTVVNLKQPQSGKKAGNDASLQLLSLCGSKVSDVRTLGKELFIFFVNALECIRIHFLMDGSVRYGEHQTRGSEPCLEIFLTDEKVFVFKSSVTVRFTDESLTHCNSLADLDICSPLFNLKRAQEKIEEKPLELICDAIMDQSILPGVGNIIKNEGLFKSAINPNTLVSDLSPVLIACLLHRLRDFSNIFYMCRKTNKPLKPHVCIYEKSVCPQCGRQVTVCKPGSLGRLTFFCSACQTNSNLNTTLSLPKKNSLLGFLKISHEPETKTKMLNCAHCTYTNTATALTCAMCLSPINECRKRKLSEEGSQSNVFMKKTKQEGQANSLSKNVGKCNAPPLCPGHQKTCSVMTVSRSGENKGRTFFCCSLRGSKQCKFFQWADLHHPVCKHGKRAIVRRVLKQNENNGKEFFCCPLPKNDQCTLFQWVEDK